MVLLGGCYGVAMALLGGCYGVARCCFGIARFLKYCFRCSLCSSCCCFFIIKILLEIVSLYVFELLQSYQNKLQKQTTTTSNATVNTTINTTTVGNTLQYS